MADRQLYSGHTNVPAEKKIRFKFLVDAGNQPTVATNPYNFGIASIVWVSQGLYRITFMDAYKGHVETIAQLNVNAAGQQRFVQPGPVANVGTATPATVDILVVDNAGAVQNPAAANANNFISGHVTFLDIGTV